MRTRMRMSSRCAGAAAALALTFTPALGVAKRAPAPRLPDLIVGSWGLSEAGSGVAPQCPSSLSAVFDRRGGYSDGDSTGTYGVKGNTLIVRIAGEDGRLGQPLVMRVVRIVSRDELVMNNGDGEFGMKRCAVD